MSRPTVVLASHSAQLADPELEMARVAAGLRRYEPIALLGEDGPLVDVLRRDGVRTEIARMRQAPGDVRALTRWLSTLRPVLVHVHTLRAGVYVGGAARALRLPVVWHLRDPSGVVARAVMRVLAAVATADS